MTPRSKTRSLSEYPDSEEIEAEEVRLTDIISGFLDPDAEDDEVAAAATHVGSELSKKYLL